MIQNSIGTVHYSHKFCGPSELHHHYKLMSFGITYNIKMDYNTFPVDHIGLKIAEYEKLVML